MTSTEHNGRMPAHISAPAQPLSFSSTAIFARAHAYVAERLAELAVRPSRANGRTGAEILANIEADSTEPAPSEPVERFRSTDELLKEIRATITGQIGAPLPSLSSALVRRKVIFGAADHADEMSGEPVDVDPIFHAIAELDRAADAFAAVWTDWTDILSTFDPTGSTDWGDDAAIVRRHFGATTEPALLAYQALLDGVEAAGQADTAAQVAFMATRPTSGFGVAAYRAAARRYAGRPTGTRADEAVMLARLDAMMAAAA